MRISLTAAVILASLFVSLPVAAQTTIPKSVTSSGGEETSSTGLVLRGTVGQAVIGTPSADNRVKLIGYWYDPGTTATGIPDPQTPNPRLTYKLHQNYPNPFNPTTTIQFDIPNNGRVSLKIYDVAGRHVTTLVDRDLIKGIHRITFDASNLASGVYFYRIRAGSFQEMKKLVLLK